MLNVYATSYYKVTSNPFLINKEDSIASPISLFCMGIGMRVGNKLVDFIGPLSTFIISVALAGIFLFSSSFMPNI
jgi:hypothetical protein